MTRLCCCASLRWRDRSARRKRTPVHTFAPVTTAPQQDVRASSALVKNLAGLLLLIVAVAGVGTAAWATDWRLGLAALSGGVGFVGWLLATSEN